MTLSSRAQTVYDIEPSCSGAEPAAATDFLNSVFATVRNGGAAGNITTGGEQAQCLVEALVQQPNVSAINQLLYCGFYQARHRSTPCSPFAVVSCLVVANTRQTSCCLPLHAAISRVVPDLLVCALTGGLQHVGSICHERICLWIQLPQHDSQLLLPGPAPQQHERRQQHAGPAICQSLEQGAKVCLRLNLSIGNFADGSQSCRG